MPGTKAKTTTLLLAFVLSSPVALSLCDAICALGAGSGSHHQAMARPIAEQPPATHAGHRYDHRAQVLQTSVPSTQLSGVNKNCVVPSNAVTASSPDRNRLLHSGPSTTVSLASIADTSVLAFALPSAIGSPPHTGPPLSTSLRI